MSRKKKKQRAEEYEMNEYAAGKAAELLGEMFDQVCNEIDEEEQIKQVRKFLNVATLTVLKKRDMAVSFRSDTGELTEANIIKANIMMLGPFDPSIIVLMEDERV